MDEFAGMVFAILQAVNATSGLRMVHITGVPDQVACEELLLGATEEDFNGRILVERAVCVRRLPDDYMQALLNKPIPDVMIVSYEIRHGERGWPARHLFYGVAEDFQSTEGCDIFSDQYRHLSADVKCINGYD
jgi:hypothetical protein